MKQFETDYGTVTVRACMLDFGRDLVDGYKIYTDDEQHFEIVGNESNYIDLDIVSNEEINDWLSQNIFY